MLNPDMEKRIIIEEIFKKKFIRQWINRLRTNEGKDKNRKQRSSFIECEKMNDN